jgi:hypothetical protein
MRMLLITGLCLFFTSCNNTGTSYHRGYVISQSQVDPELEAPPVEADVTQLEE